MRGKPTKKPLTNRTLFLKRHPSAVRPAGPGSPRLIGSCGWCWWDRAGCGHSSSAPALWAAGLGSRASWLFSLLQLAPLTLTSCQRLSYIACTLLTLWHLGCARPGHSQPEVLLTAVLHLQVHMEQLRAGQHLSVHTADQWIFALLLASPGASRSVRGLLSTASTSVAASALFTHTACRLVCSPYD